MSHFIKGFPFSSKIGFFFPVSGSISVKVRLIGFSQPISPFQDTGAFQSLGSLKPSSSKPLLLPPLPPKLPKEPAPGLGVPGLLPPPPPQHPASPAPPPPPPPALLS